MTWESKLEKRPRHVRAIGMIAIEIANLELFLAELFARALFISIPIGEAIYLTPRSSTARLDILESAATAALMPRRKHSSHPEDQRKAREMRRVQNIVKRSRGVLTQRHEIMHGGWAFSEKEREVGRVEMPPQRSESGKFSGILVRISDLTNLIRDIRQLITDIQDLSEEFREHPPTLADMRISLHGKNPQQNPPE